jgi:hypothetical protein
MSTVVQPEETRPRTAASHVLGAGLGLAFAAAVMALTSWESRLRDELVRDGRVETIWVIVGSFAVAGVLTLLAVVLSRRMPWLPTVAAVTLLYYLLAAIPGDWSSELPYPDWAPVLRWSLTSVGLLVGLLAATAAWSWWSYLRRPAAH